MIILLFKGSGGVPFTQLELLEATHRGLHKFVPRHHDEIDLEIGDPIYVQKEADDLWCEGKCCCFFFCFICKVILLIFIPVIL